MGKGNSLRDTWRAIPADTGMLTDYGLDLTIHIQLGVSKGWTRSHSLEVVSFPQTVKAGMCDTCPVSHQHCILGVLEPAVSCNKKTTQRLDLEAQA